MAIKKCAICGKDFETKGRGKICPDCHVANCCVCGKEIPLNDYGVTQMIKRGWITCGGKCRAEMTRRGLMEREGIVNVSQRKNKKTKTKTCEICGKEFEGTGNARVCDACHVVTCPVCGKEFRPSAPSFSRYRKQGWLTCSSQCRAEMTRRCLLDDEGVLNVSQRPEVREKLRDVRLNDSFDLDRKGTPSAHWYNPKTEQHFTDAYVNKLGVDKLLGTNYGKGTSNKDLMVNEGFVAIYDCGQSRFVWHKK